MECSKTCDVVSIGHSTLWHHTVACQHISSHGILQSRLRRYNRQEKPKWLPNLLRRIACIVVVEKTAGDCVFKHGIQISWHNGYRGIAAERYWFRSLLQELGIEVPTPYHIFYDNLVVTLSARNSTYRTKKKRRHISHIPNTKQCADILTKVLRQTPFERLKHNLIADIRWVCSGVLMS